MVYMFSDEPDSLFHFDTVISDDSSNVIKKYSFTNLRYKKLQNCTNIYTQTLMHCPSADDSANRVG